MIDHVKMISAEIDQAKARVIVESNSLQYNSSGERVFYQTSKHKKNRENLLLKLEANRVTIECSLHKQYEKLMTGHYTNYGKFDLISARNQAYRVLGDLNLHPSEVLIKGYEIGVNLFTKHDPLYYLDRMTTIVQQGKERLIYINPKYKDERVRTTVMHTNVRKFFKAYDKCFEAKDKRRKDIPNHNILRIETVFRRVEDMTVERFFSLDNLQKIFNRFISDWLTVSFRRDIAAGATPKTPLQIEVVRQIELLGSVLYLEKLKNELKTKKIAPKYFRNRREFVQKFNDYKQPQSIEEQEFNHLLAEVKNKLKIKGHGLPLK